MTTHAPTYPVTGRRTYSVAQAGVGSLGAGGPFLLQVDGVSHILLSDGVSRLLITGQAPVAPGFVPTFYLLGF